MNAAAQKNDILEPQQGQAAVRHIAVSKPKVEPEMSIVYRVRDLLAYAGPRTHELPDTRGILQKFVFPDDRTFIDMPLPLAAKLIGNEGFEVINERGYQMRAERLTDDSANQGVILAFDEVVAKYEELTHEAIVERGKRAGGAFSKANKKDEIISFLIEESLKNPVGKQKVAAAEGDEELAVEEEDEFA